MDICVCVVFSFSMFFVAVCTIFICAVFLWAPEHLCDLGLDLGDELNERNKHKQELDMTEFRKDPNLSLPAIPLKSLHF